MSVPHFDTNTDPGDEQPITKRSILERIIPHEDSDTLVVRRFSCTFLNVDERTKDQVVRAMVDLGPIKDAFAEYTVTIVISRSAA